MVLDPFSCLDRLRPALILVSLCSLGSVEGLSLPFLVQWLLGDTTNLIGCLLTKQLPFQVGSKILFSSHSVCTKQLIKLI
jgi:hypothetical protein